MPQISLGRIVHYATDDEILAAICTRVYADGSADLTVFVVGGDTYSVECQEGEGPGTWHWPPRV